MDYKENESEVGLYLKTLVYQNIQRLANSDLRLKSKIINPNLFQFIILLSKKIPTT